MTAVVRGVDTVVFIQGIRVKGWKGVMCGRTFVFVNPKGWK